MGRLWTAEVGDPDDPDHLPFIHSWSPVHNVRPASAGIQYPAMLVTTGDHDTRVVPGHSLKLIAQLQCTSPLSIFTSTAYAYPILTLAATLPQNPNVFLGRIYENAGHECKSKQAPVRERRTDQVI